MKKWITKEEVQEMLEEHTILKGDVAEIVERVVERVVCDPSFRQALEGHGVVFQGPLDKGENKVTKHVDSHAWA